MKPTEIFADKACRCGCGSTEPVGHEKDADLARRGFLCNAIASTAVLAGATVIRAQPASAQSTLTPEAALKALLDGNQRYVGGQLQALDEDLSILKAKTVEKQEPFAAVLSCADSRVPVEFIFDQSIGQLFVVRVAGNVTTPEIMASLEYGVAVLGTKVLVVLGHGNCGAVKATIEGKAVPGQISVLYAPSGRRWTLRAATLMLPLTLTPGCRRHCSAMPPPSSPGQFVQPGLHASVR